MSADLPVPVFDNHMHLDPRGRVEEAVKDFHRSGGTHFMLVHKPYGLNRTVDDHRDAFDTTLRLAERAREAAAVQVWVAMAPHPAEFTELLKAGVALEDAAEVYRGAIHAAARVVETNEDVVCMGEVGRPHWRPVEPRVLEAANGLMREAFEVARDVGVPVQIHAETATTESYADLAEHLKAAGLPAERAVKHYSSPIVDTAENCGLWPSVLVGKDSAEQAIGQGTRFLMETDYMDDPDYPGAVLGPKTVPKRTLHLLESGAMTEEEAWTVHVENPRRVYGVEFDA